MSENFNRPGRSYKERREEQRTRKEKGQLQEASAVASAEATSVAMGGGEGLKQNHNTINSTINPTININVNGGQPSMPGVAGAENHSMGRIERTRASDKGRELPDKNRKNATEAKPGDKTEDKLKAVLPSKLDTKTPRGVGDDLKGSTVPDLLQRLKATTPPDGDPKNQKSTPKELDDAHVKAFEKAKASGQIEQAPKPAPTAAPKSPDKDPRLKGKDGRPDFAMDQMSKVDQLALYKIVSGDSKAKEVPQGFKTNPETALIAQDFFKSKERLLEEFKKEYQANRKAKKDGIEEGGAAAARARIWRENAQKDYDNKLEKLKKGLFEDFLVEKKKDFPDLTKEDMQQEALNFSASFLLETAKDIDMDLEAGKSRVAYESKEKGIVSRLWDKYTHAPKWQRLLIGAGLAAGIGAGAAFLFAPGLVVGAAAGSAGLRSLASGTTSGVLQSLIEKFYIRKKFGKERAAVGAAQQAETLKELIKTVGESKDWLQNDAIKMKLMGIVDADALEYRKKLDVVANKEGRTRLYTALATGLVVGGTAAGISWYDSLYGSHAGLGASGSLKPLSPGAGAGVGALDSSGAPGGVVPGGTDPAWADTPASADAPLAGAGVGALDSSGAPGGVVPGGTDPAWADTPASEDILKGRVPDATGPHASADASLAGAGIDKPLSLTPASSLGAASIDPIETAKSGDSVWRMAERQLSHRIDGWDKLAEGQRTYLIDAVKDKVAENPAKFGLSNVDQVKLNQPVNFSSIFEDHSAVQELVTKTKSLSEATIKQIENHNSLISGWVTANPGSALTSERVEEILSGMSSVPSDSISIDSAPTVASGGMLAANEGLYTGAGTLAENAFGSARESVTAQAIGFDPNEYRAIKSVPVKTLLAQIPSENEAWKIWRGEVPGVKAALPHEGSFYWAPEYAKQIRLAGFIRDLKPGDALSNLTVNQFLGRYGIQQAA